MRTILAALAFAAFATGADATEILTVKENVRACSEGLGVCVNLKKGQKVGFFEFANSNVNQTNVKIQGWHDVYTVATKSLIWSVDPQMMQRCRD